MKLYSVNNINIDFKTFLLLIICVLVLFYYDHAQADMWDKLQEHEGDYNEAVEDYKWQEGETFLPDLPVESDLLAIDSPPTHRHFQFFLDGKNLKIGEDGVVRYTLVIRSNNGAENLFYEGLRCSTSQIKTFAYGGFDKTNQKRFMERPDAKWQYTTTSGAKAYSRMLANNYFCNHHGKVLSHQEIMQSIKYGKETFDVLYD